MFIKLIDEDLGKIKGTGRSQRPSNQSNYLLLLYIVPFNGHNVHKRDLKVIRLKLLLIPRWEKEVSLVKFKNYP